MAIVHCQKCTKMTFILRKTVMATKRVFGETLPFNITPVPTGPEISDFFVLKS